MARALLSIKSLRCSMKRRSCVLRSVKKRRKKSEFDVIPKGGERRKGGRRGGANSPDDGVTVGPVARRTHRQFSLSRQLREQVDVGEATRASTLDIVRHGRSGCDLAPFALPGFSVHTLPRVNANPNRPKNGVSFEQFEERLSRRTRLGSRFGTRQSASLQFFTSRVFLRGTQARPG